MYSDPYIATLTSSLKALVQQRKYQSERLGCVGFPSFVAFPGCGLCIPILRNIHKEFATGGNVVQAELCIELGFLERKVALNYVRHD